MVCHMSSSREQPQKNREPQLNCPQARVQPELFSLIWQKPWEQAWDKSVQRVKGSFRFELKLVFVKRINADLQRCQSEKDNVK